MVSTLERSALRTLILHCLGAFNVGLLFTTMNRLPSTITSRLVGFEFGYIGKAAVKRPRNKDGTPLWLNEQEESILSRYEDKDVPICTGCIRFCYCMHLVTKVTVEKVVRWKREPLVNCYHCGSDAFKMVYSSLDFQFERNMKRFQITRTEGLWLGPELGS